MTLKFALAPSNTDDILYTQAGTPTLDLRFASSKSLNDYVSGQNLIDFTRGGNGVGTYVGSDGLIKNSVVNLLLQSEDFSTAWGRTNLLAFGSGSTVNAAIAPDGTATADLITEDTTASALHRISQGSLTLAAGSATFSVYAKRANGARNLEINASVLLDGRAVFDLSNGTIGEVTNGTASIQDVGNGWYRCSVTGTSVGTTSTANLQLCTGTASSTRTYTGDGTSGIYIWGAQLEQSSTAGEYVKTTSSISGAPRFDHDPETGESLGLLIEEQRTNLLLYSAFDSNWTTAGFGTATYDLGLSALGVFSGVSVGSLGQDWHTLFRSGISLTASTVYAFTLFYRAGTSGRCRLVFRNNSTGTETLIKGAVGSLSVTSASAGSATVLSQYLCSDGLTYKVTGTYTPNGTSADHWFRIGPDSVTSGETVIALGGQLEAGSFPTSYIPTTSAQVTRNADVAQITGSNFSRWYSQSQGTVFALAIPRGSNTAYSTIGDGTSNNRFQLYSENNGILLRTAAAGSAANNTIGSQVVNAPLRVAYSYGAGGTAASLNGGSATTTTQILPTTNTTLGIGQYFAIPTLNSVHIRRLTYFDRRLPNATLQSITSDTAPTTYGNLTLDNGTRAQSIAGVAPTLDYRFARDRREIETVSLSDKLTFTGGNQGTFVGSDGYIQRATTNVPRFDHDPVSRVSEGLLVEGSRENLLTYSEAMSASPWGRASATAVADAGVAPDGATTADKIISTGGGCFRAGVGVANATAYTYSVFLKHVAGTGVVSAVGFERFGATPLAGTSAFNLLTGVITANGANVQSSSITPYSNGWYRVSVTATSTDVTTTIVNYTGVSGNEFLVWGAQLEANASTPSTYIPTTTTTVTRTADSAVIDGTGVLTGTYTMVEKPAGCAIESGGNIVLQEGYTAERVMVFPAALTAQQITTIREAM